MNKKKGKMKMNDKKVNCWEESEGQKKLTDLFNFDQVEAEHLDGTEHLKSSIHLIYICTTIIIVIVVFFCYFPLCFILWAILYGRHKQAIITTFLTMVFRAI